MHFYSITPETVNAADPAAADYPARLREVLRWTEDNRFRGVLVPYSMREIDPWMVAGSIGSDTRSLRPLIAVQPDAIPPHTAAQAAAAYAALYGRPLDFNLIAGADPTALQSVGDTSTKEVRYVRLRSWGLILRGLLTGDAVIWQDEHYTYQRLGLEPWFEVLRECRLFVAGSSESSQRIAAEVADVAVTHPLPFEEWSRTTLPSLRSSGFRGDLGIRIGVLARSTADEAWALAHNRFPRTWAGDQETKLKTISTNTWSKELATKALAGAGKGHITAEAGGVYWLGAFVNGGASAPMLVGSYEDVASALSEYGTAGVGHVILTGIHKDDYSHTSSVIERLRGGQGTGTFATAGH